MSNSRSLSELASIIQDKIAIVDQTLKDAGLDQPSFHAGASMGSQIPESIEETKFDLLEAIGDLQALLYGPVYYLVSMTGIIPNNAAVFGVLTKFKIAEKLETDECITYAELGKRCGLPESDTRRFVRGAISLRFFEEPETGKVRHNAASLALAMPAGSAWTRSNLRNSVPSALNLPDALAQYPGSENPKETGFALANGGRDFFTVLQEEPDRGADFALSMTLQTQSPARSISHCVEALTAWDDASKCPKVLVDIGGSHGELAELLLRRFPSLQQAVVQDLPKSIADAQVPKDLEESDRLKLMEYDFFTEQPVKDADVYFMRQILHDWSDSKCVEILKNQIPALKPGARIILNETCPLPPGAHTHARDVDHRGYDIAMKTFSNGKERTSDDFHTLFSTVDNRFEISSIRRPPGSAMSIIEVVWKG